ncbi:MAG: NAD(P)/FAD-dependent oxidoreductase [Candidatus Micrarchaeia archaeon]
MPETVYDPNVHDIAIIGAGPAGLSAAYTAAKAGLETIVLEEHKTVGEPVHCGEGLSQFAIERMKLDVPKEALGLKVKGIRIVFPDGTSTIFKEEGYDLNKNLFEQFLAVRAQGEGANLRTQTRVMGMERKNGVWSLNSPNCAIKARAIIDATGYQSISNSLLKINPEPARLVSGVQYYMQDVPTDGFIEFHIQPRLAPHGYLWIMPKEAGFANVGLVSNDPKNLHKNLKQFISEKGLEKCKLIRPFGGMIPESGPFERTYSDGLLMAGDAAGFTSPMFEGGTQLSLKSGELAALTLIDAAKNSAGTADLFSEQALSKYQSAWKKEFPPYGKLLDGKKHFYGFSESDFNKLGRILPEDISKLTTSDKLKIGIRLLSISPNLLLKNFMSAMNTFSYSTGEHYGW